MMRPIAYSRPAGVDEAVALVRGDPKAMFIAGGTEVLNLVRERQLSPGHLVDIGALPLERLDEGRHGLRIGALARGIENDPRIRARYPVIREAILAAASPQVRNMATPGGNLLQRTRCPFYRDPTFACNRRDPGTGCSAQEGYNRSNAIFGGSSHCIAVHPSDLAVALTALDAVVHTQRRAIPIEELYRLPGDTPERETVLEHGEIIVAIQVPAKGLAGRSHYVKVRDRASFAFALASAAVALDIQDGVVRAARIALGGVAPRPWRARSAERTLIGKPLTTQAMAEAGKAAVEGARPRRHNAFKVPLARETVTRALRGAGQR